MKVVLGSTSDDKKRIVKAALKSLGVKAVIEGVTVSSGISEQPLDKKTTICGAVNRAVEALKIKTDSDLAVGLEGGLDRVKDSGFFLVCAAAIYDKSGGIYLGTSRKIKLPKEVSEKIEEGAFFGTVIREYRKKVRKNKALFNLSDQLITRNVPFSEAIRNAYKSFKEGTLYQKF
ncbi:inosine/xanthosine triphosphatase [Patescibacteria group bacterium]|nr:inosine/xanthosine triphosphatase [Patescibacteria group bacterium]